MTGRVTERGDGLEKLFDSFGKLAKLQVTIGLQGPQAAAPHSSERGFATLAAVGAFSEFGTISAHERSWLRSAILEKQGEIAAMFRKAIKSITEGADPIDELAKIGAKVAGFVRDKIRTAKSWAEPLADPTVKRKGHDVPLRDTEKMLENVTWAIRKDGQIVKQGK